MTEATPKSPPRIVVVAGATGIGKTARAIELAQKVGGEIVNADSMQIYRHMDIGTAKPTADELGRVPHHLIDIVDPDDHFDAARYYKVARAVVGDLLKRNVVPFVVGGTGFYIKALLYGLFEARPSDPVVRQKLRAQAAAEGNAAMHAHLAAQDPQTAGRLHPNDSFRVVRALEVIAITGAPLSELHHRHGFSDAPYNACMIGLDMPRAQLYDRINRRVDLMIAQGLQAEVTRLLDQGYDAGLKSMQSIGYRHMIAYLTGRLDWSEMMRTLKRDTRRYAKRQYTWMRRMAGLNWLRADQPDKLLAATVSFLEKQR